MTLDDINESFACDITEEVLSEALTVGLEMANHPV
jgi:hypothetical protein